MRHPFVIQSFTTPFRGLGREGGGRGSWHLFVSCTTCASGGRHCAAFSSVEAASYFIRAICLRRSATVCTLQACSPVR